MSKVKSAFMCDACDGRGHVLSPTFGSIACPYCHGSGLTNGEPDDDPDPCDFRFLD